MLKSQDGNCLFDIELVHLDSNEHKGWIGYELVFRDGSTHSCLKSSEELLFFENNYDPEVIVFCKGLEEVVRGAQEFVFEPIDEKDFTFKAVRSGEVCRVTITINIDEDNCDVGKWGQGVPVQLTDLKLFSAELEQRYLREFRP